MRNNVTYNMWGRSSLNDLSISKEVNLILISDVDSCAAIRNIDVGGCLCKINYNRETGTYFKNMTSFVSDVTILSFQGERTIT